MATRDPASASVTFCHVPVVRAPAHLRIVHDFNDIARTDRTRNQRTRDNCAKAGAGKYAIYGQAKGKIGIADIGAADGSHKRLFQGFNAFSGCGRNTNNGHIGKECVFEMLADIFLDHICPFFINCVTW